LFINQEITHWVFIRKLEVPSIFIVQQLIMTMAYTYKQLANVKRSRELVTPIDTVVLQDSRVGSLIIWEVLLHS